MITKENEKLKENYSNLDMKRKKTISKEDIIEGYSQMCGLKERAILDINILLSNEEFKEDNINYLGI